MYIKQGKYKLGSKYHLDITGHMLTMNPKVSPVQLQSMLTETQGYKTILCSTQLSMKFILLINVKMVGILTFISRINTASESLKARKIYIFQHFSFRAVKISGSVEYEKSYITLGEVLMYHNIYIHGYFRISITRAFFTHSRISWKFTGTLILYSQMRWQRMGHLDSAAFHQGLQ